MVKRKVNREERGNTGKTSREKRKVKERGCCRGRRGENKRKRNRRKQRVKGRKMIYCEEGSEGKVKIKKSE